MRSSLVQVSNQLPVYPLLFKAKNTGDVPEEKIALADNQQRYTLINQDNSQARLLFGQQIGMRQSDRVSVQSMGINFTEKSCYTANLNYPDVADKPSLSSESSFDQFAACYTALLIIAHLNAAINMLKALVQAEEAKRYLEEIEERIKESIRELDRIIKSIEECIISQLNATIEMLKALAKAERAKHALEDIEERIKSNIKERDKIVKVLRIMVEFFSILTEKNRYHKKILLDLRKKLNIKTTRVENDVLIQLQDIREQRAKKPFALTNQIVL